MELLGALEEKLKRLVALVKELRSQKEKLEDANLLLRDRISQLELALSKKDDDLNRMWDQEKASARKVVDELISDIDSLIESGSSQ